MFEKRFDVQKLGVISTLFLKFENLFRDFQKLKDYTSQFILSL